MGKFKRDLNDMTTSLHKQAEREITNKIIEAIPEASKEAQNFRFHHIGQKVELDLNSISPELKASLKQHFGL